MSVKRLVPLHAVVLDSDPTATRMGEIYFNSVDSELRFYDGTSWLPIGSGGMVSGLLDHIHTYDGAVFSVETVEVNASGTVDGGTP
jgi:hypothetical protein